MALTRRYEPPHVATGDPVTYGMDFSTVVPVGMTLAKGSANFSTNTQPPVHSTDFTIGQVYLRARAVFATVTGGVIGTDYVLTFEVTDDRGGVWARAALLLCSVTS